MGTLNLVISPGEFGVMAIDPGKATGVAQGVFRNSRTIHATVRRAVAKGALKATVLADVPPEEQAHYLAVTWRQFRFRCVTELMIPEAAVFLVVESFALRQMAVDLVPVEVTAGLRAVQHTPKVDGWADDVEPWQWRDQSASEAMTFATDDRMRAWNVWQVGLAADRRGTSRLQGDHARAALRHVCLGVNKCLEGKWER